MSISLYNHIGEFDGEGIRFDSESLGIKLVASVNKYDVIDEELSKIHENINIFIKSSNYIEMIKECRLCQVDGVDKRFCKKTASGIMIIFCLLTLMLTQIASKLRICLMNL